MSDLTTIGFRGAIPSDEGAEADQDFLFIDGNSIKKRELPVSKLAWDSIDLAYEVNGKAFLLKDSTINGGRLADTHWKALSYSCDREATNQYGYKAVAFINHHTHEIHIASAGTVADRHDILDDLLLACGKVPYKLQPLKALVDRVVQEVGGSAAAGAYRFSTSGHSLGAVVADLTGLEIASRGLSLVSSTTFENPGSARAIQAVLANQWLSGKLDSDQLAELQGCYKVYNAKPNFINTAQPQFGQCYLVQPPIAEPPQRYGLWSFAQNLCGLVGGGLVVNAFARYLGLNHLAQDLTEVKNNHGLRNFQDWEEQRKTAVVQWPSGRNRQASLYAKPVSENNNDPSEEALIKRPQVNRSCSKAALVLAPALVATEVASVVTATAASMVASMAASIMVMGGYSTGSVEALQKLISAHDSSWPPMIACA